jgi:hypothetical protein
MKVMLQITLFSNKEDAQEQIPHANGPTHNCFVKSSGISAGPCIKNGKKENAAGIFVPVLRFLQ